MKDITRAKGLVNGPSVNGMGPSRTVGLPSVKMNHGGVGVTQGSGGGTFHTDHQGCNLNLVILLRITKIVRSLVNSFNSN